MLPKLQVLNFTITSNLTETFEYIVNTDNTYSKLQRYFLRNLTSNYFPTICYLFKKKFGTEQYVLQRYKGTQIRIAENSFSVDAAIINNETLTNTPE